ncbi:MAG: hypothetical protein WCS57_06345, partial [Bacillota bacterium]
MKKSTKFRLAVLLASAMVLGVCSGVLGEVEYVAGESSDGGIPPEVREGPYDPIIDGCETVTYGPPAKYEDYELLDGAIRGKVYQVDYSGTSDPFGKHMYFSWEATENVTVVYVFVR